MKMYGSYSDEDLNNWQQFPQIASVLTSSLFGAWLMRRDENKTKQFPTVSLDKVKQAREKIANKHDDPAMLWEEKDYGRNEMIDEVLEILDRLIESESE